MRKLYKGTFYNLMVGKYFKTAKQGRHVRILQIVDPQLPGRPRYDLHQPLGRRVQRCATSTIRRSNGPAGRIPPGPARRRE